MDEFILKLWAMKNCDEFNRESQAEERATVLALFAAVTGNVSILKRQLSQVRYVMYLIKQQATRSSRMETFLLVA